MQAYTKSGKDYGMLHHGGKQYVQVIDPHILQSRDHGYFGRGFYTTTRRDVARHYGGRITRLIMRPEAKVLVAAINPKEADPAFIKAVQDAYYQHCLPYAQAHGKLAALEAEIAYIATDRFTFVYAVNTYADMHKYDIIYFLDSEILVKNPDSVVIVTGK